MAMENPPFVDVFPIQDGDFPLLCLFTGGYVCFQIYGRVVFTLDKLIEDQERHLDIGKHKARTRKNGWSGITVGS